MTRLTTACLIAAAAVAIALASPGSAFAAKKKAAASTPACTAGTLCTAACNTAKWCNVNVCMAGGQRAATAGFCYEGSPFCPPKC